MCRLPGSRISSITGGRSLRIPPFAWDEEKIREDTIQIPVQVNGKVRATVEIGVNEEQDSVLEKAHAMKNVQVYLDGKTIVKEIYVKGRIVNIVVK